MTRYKPFYKKLLSLKRNVIYTKKIFKFKKKKWKTFIFHFSKLLSYNSNKYKIYDHDRYSLKRFLIYFKSSYRYRLMIKKRLRTFYFNLKRKYVLRQLILKSKKTKIKQNLFILKLLESRLDVVLFRAGFVKTIRTARLLIQNKLIYVNKKIVKTSSIMLKPGDLIEIKKSYFSKLKSEISKNYPLRWHFTVNHLQINYRIFQIIFLGHPTTNNFYYMYPFWLDLESWRKSYRY